MRQFSGLDPESSPRVKALQCMWIGIPREKNVHTFVTLICYFLENNYGEKFLATGYIKQSFFLNVGNMFIDKTRSFCTAFSQYVGLV